ncbi:ankyrin repeat domain-containing protein [Micromonospora sp. NPDC050187]|uniref:ankyrin repeat domain-containing protein n=1 Tax=Micromonospora sp. NPDC050187 TaxID=3364277 RepID=UPI0037A5F1F5
MNTRQRKKLTKRLMEAVLREDAAMTGALLRLGADPDAADREGTTPLYQASVHGAVHLVRLLLEAGAAPDTESGHGREGTPLCAAAAWGHTDVVRELLAHDADPNLREDGGSGYSPLDWARRGDHSPTVDLLLAAGAHSPAAAMSLGVTSSGGAVRTTSSAPGTTPGAPGRKHR